TPNDLAGIACQEQALARLVSYQPRRRQWNVRQGPFTKDDFGTLAPSHWTLLVQEVDQWDIKVGALLDFFTFLPRWRIEDIMVSYAVDGGSVGAHVDHYDVFLIQGLGQREWRIDVNPTAPKAFRKDVEIKLLKVFKPSHRWILEPGDML